MSTGPKFKQFAGRFILCISVVCLGGLSVASTSAHAQRRVKKAPLPPLPNGPLGPVPQIPLDSIAAVPPQVNYENGQLTIVAANSTLGDILKAVRKQTGAEIEVPVATDRVVTHLGPGPAREVMAELLNGSRFNYVLLGSPENGNALTRVVLVAKATPEPANPNNQVAAQPQPDPTRANYMAPPPPDQQQEDAPDAEAADAVTDENADDAANADNGDQAADADQPVAAPGDQQAPKTPQQMLQEMQQRQMQIQQQQLGQVPIPGARPPQDQ